MANQLDTIQTTALLRSAKILRRVLEPWGDLSVTQTPVKVHQLLTLVWKSRSKNDNSNSLENDQSIWLKAVGSKTGQLIYQQDPDTKKLVRKLERKNTYRNFKRKFRWSLTQFVTTIICCLNYTIYIYIYI